MRRNFKIGLILGIAVLMLFPVYARAQMNLNNLYQGGSPGISVVNIAATQGDTITFVVTCPSSTAAVFNMVLNPDPGVATFPTNATGANAIFTWNTGGTPPAPTGSYTAVFQASYGTELDQLIVMITINPSAGGSTPPPSNDTTPPTITTFSVPSTSSSLTVSPITLSATDNAGGTGVAGYMLTESSGQPSASATGWSGTTAPTSYTFGTAGSKTLYAWAKDAAGNVSTSMSASVTITLPSPSPSPPSNFSPLVVLNNSQGGDGYGYNLYSASGEYTISAGKTIYFEVPPNGQIPGKTYSSIGLYLYQYFQYNYDKIQATLYTLNAATNQVTLTQGPGGVEQNQMEMTLQGVYYIIGLHNITGGNLTISIWWIGFK